MNPLHITQMLPHKRLVLEVLLAFSFSLTFFISGTLDSFKLTTHPPREDLTLSLVIGVEKKIIGITQT